MPTAISSCEPTDVSASGIGLAARIMQAWQTAPSEIERLVRSASPAALVDAWAALRRSSDSTESLIAVARALAAAPPGDARWLTPEARQRRLGQALLYRGHVREAGGILVRATRTAPPNLMEAALLGGIPAESAGPMFHRWLEKEPLALVALPWWLSRRDSASIREFGRKGDSVAAASRDENVRAGGRYRSERRWRISPCCAATPRRRYAAWRRCPTRFARSATSIG